MNDAYPLSLLRQLADKWFTVFQFIFVDLNFKRPFLMAYVKLSMLTVYMARYFLDKRYGPDAYEVVFVFFFKNLGAFSIIELYLLGVTLKVGKVS